MCLNVVPLTANQPCFHWIFLLRAESERALGRALRNSGKDRSEYVLASKVNAPNLAYDKVIAACNRSLENLGMEYIDLYQVHWPVRIGCCLLLRP